MTHYFLYTRKSTDVEDKQVRSIEDQLAVLRALAKTEGLNIVEEFIEKQSAKVPGRPVFNEMLARIEKGEAQGIVCWKLDRLARNPVDGGQISWFIQRGIIQHIQTHDRSYRPTDNILMMSVEFGMANQFILDLSANTKRGLHEKVKRGEYPSLAPIGYINNRINKTIVVDKKTAKSVLAAFELYAKGDARLEDVAAFFSKQGVLSDSGKTITRDRATYILSNPFYIGLFRYAGELHEGKHQPIVSKKLFDRVQEVLKKRGWQNGKENDPRPFCGLLRCAECGCSITGEAKVKRQKNGNIHHYTYYHCTKKKGFCSQPCVREEALAGQLSDILKKFILPSDWATELLKMAERDEKEATQSSATASQATREEITAITKKLRILLEARLDEDIDREQYREQKAELLSRKKSLEEKMAELSEGVIAWLEPLRQWIKDAENAGETVVSPSLPLKKSFTQKIFGSNLYLRNKEIEFVPQTQWAALCAARQKISENSFCFILEA